GASPGRLRTRPDSRRAGTEQRSAERTSGRSAQSSSASWMVPPRVRPGRSGRLVGQNSLAPRPLSVRLVKDLDDIDVALLRGRVGRSLAVLVQRGGVGAVLQEIIHDVLVAVGGGEVKRGAVVAASDGDDLGVGLDELLHVREVA